MDVAGNKVFYSSNEFSQLDEARKLCCYCLVECDTWDVCEVLDSSYNYVLLIDLPLLQQIRKLPSHISVIVPLMSIPEEFYGSDVTIWIQVTRGSALSGLELQKLSTYPNLKLYVTEISDALRCLLLNCKEVVVQDTQLVPQISTIERNLSKLYQNSQFIITPLNPLADNLSVQVYEQFQKDKIKYQQYEDAIELAIQDLKTQYTDLRVLVIGAGMGNLVDSVFKFCSHITVIEKNPQTIDILRRRNHNDWNSEIDLIFDDVRNVDVGDKYHLVVSEMLGSFGCNELFPEILQRIKPQIMIPEYITSIVAPIYSTIVNHTVFLNNLRNYYRVADYQRVWEYNYPGQNDNEHQSEFQFPVQIDGKVNAFEGLFRADLYGNIGITNMKGPNYCNSWFSMVFPIDEIIVKKGDLLKSGAFSMEL
ncbi:PRMT5-domain-containing protein [Yamadazyma tenuis]|uniref:PRMT5-domain-containing protein n=1 Tax=Candida tenuis TaxID=2315449 RepID=UPI0027A9DD1E|nr:PRMT5-domain-containing protein [Yamadazyma tenuis]